MVLTNGTKWGKKFSVFAMERKKKSDCLNQALLRGNVLGSHSEGWSCGDGVMDVRDSLCFFFLFTRISSKHPMCQIVFLEVGLGGGGRCLLAEETKGIVCPYLSILFSGNSAQAAESRGRLKQWFNTWLLSLFISVITPPHPTQPPAHPVHPESHLLLLHHPL